MAQARSRVAVLVALGMAAAGCGGGGGAGSTRTSTPTSATSLAIASGDGQSGIAGLTLSAPLVVVARDGSGNGIPGVLVTFASSAGSVSQATATTDRRGRAQTALTVAPGASTVTASAPGLNQVTFTAVGLVPNAPPSIVFSAGPALRAFAHEEVRFDVTVADPEGQPVSARLLTVPPACVFEPITGATGPATRTLRWRVSGFSAGLQRLEFLVTDGAATVRSTVTVSVTGGGDSQEEVGDVTGDGLPDLVAVASFADVSGTSDCGAVYVWAGGSSPSGAPSATLVVPGAAAADLLGRDGVRLGDVTGDGTLDVVVATHYADVGGVANAGAVYVWHGGPTLAGAVSPTATLRVSGAVAGDQLTEAEGQGVVLADVTGEGTLDVVVGAQFADVGGRVGTGAIYVWRGGAALTGTLDPTATLRVPDAAWGDGLGIATGQAIQTGDVTGDGTLDIVGVASVADVGTMASAGAIYVWRGHTGLSGVVDPTAVLAGRAPGDRLGSASRGSVMGEGAQLGDVTGDGTLDVVGATQFADVDGVIDAGAVYVWQGGTSLAGTLAPLATLRVPGASTEDQLGEAIGKGVKLGDVTADGVLDLVVGSGFVDVGGVVDAGAIYVWQGGPSLSGTLDPLATLRVPGAATGDWLARSFDQGFQLADITGDGELDVVAAAERADVAGVVNAGAVYVWVGGALTGTLDPTATLRVPGAAVGLADSPGQSVQFGDVTGDGLFDVVVAARFAEPGGVASAGAAFVWSGGPTLLGTVDPVATLRAPGAQPGDQLTNSSGHGIQLGDVTGDGGLDVVIGAAPATVNGIDSCGAAFVWEGGATLTGTPDPRATLRVPGAQPDDNLGSGAPQGVALIDLNGDGTLDVFAITRHADVGGVADVGAAYLWAGGAALSGTPDPSTTLTVATAVAGDALGSAIWRVADFTGDGTPDLVGGSSSADVGGVADTGCLYLWRGGAGFSGSVGPTVTLSVPGAVAGDQLTF
jgi:hypothetical protein